MTRCELIAGSRDSPLNIDVERLLLEKTDRLVRVDSAVERLLSGT
jgi:hypothetical protein